MFTDTGWHDCDKSEPRYYGRTTQIEAISANMNQILAQQDTSELCNAQYALLVYSLSLSVFVFVSLSISLYLPFSLSLSLRCLSWYSLY